MKIAKMLPRNSKKGLTLIEIVFGVVVLSIITLGIITALTTANTKIVKNKKESVAHTEATQMLDAVISAISHGGYETAAQILDTNNGVMKELFGSGCDATLTIIGGDTKYTYAKAVEGGNVDVIMGWLVQIEYDGITVRGYASNTKGAFDKNE